MMSCCGIVWHHYGMNDCQYRTAAEVARELGVSLRTVRRWIADGRLPATRVGRAVRIPVDAYRQMVPYGGSVIEHPSRESRRIAEVAAGYSSATVAPNWPDTPERLSAQRRNAAALMDRLAARGRPASGPADTADALLDAVREEFGVVGTQSGASSIERSDR